MSNSNEKSVANLQRHEFDTLRPSSRFCVRPIRKHEISGAAGFAAGHLPSLNLDDLSVFEQIILHDRDTIQLIEADGRLVGIYAMLFLNRSGLDGLLNGRFDGTDPQFDHLAEKSANPAAIYTWFIACPGRAAAAIGNVARLLQGERFAHADLYARPATPAGLRIMLGTGHLPVSSDPNGLHRYTRLANRQLNSQLAA